MSRFVRSALVLALTVAVVAAGGCGLRETSPLRMLVMDPLAAPLACECVAGFAQRDYGRLGVFLAGRLGREVEVAFAEQLGEAMRVNPGKKVDLVIGKRSVVIADAAAAGVSVRPIAMLTDPAGRTGLTGLVVVRADDPARTVADLKGRRILLGPVDSDEKSAAAVALFRSEGVPLPAEPETRASCNAAGVDVADGKADAAVISDYALALLEGCDAIDKGVLRIVGRTKPVPFVTVFALGDMSDAAARAVVEALSAVKTDAKLLTAMESKNGFVPLAAAPARPSCCPPDGPGE